MPTITFSISSSKMLGVKYKPSKRQDCSLHFAAAIGNSKLIIDALKNGQQVDSYFDGITPLHAAARAGNTTAVHLLVGARAELNVAQMPHKPDSRVESGTAGGITQDFRRAWQSGYTGTEGCTPLHFAAARGHYGVMGFLLEQGADFTRPDKQGVTPLMLAKNMGQENAATILHNWANNHDVVDKPVLSNSPIKTAPKPLTIKRSLESFIPRSWKGSPLNPKRTRSNASMPPVGTHNRSMISLSSGSNSIAPDTEGTRLDPNARLRTSPIGGRVYRNDSRNSSLLSIGEFVGSRLFGSQLHLAVSSEDKDEATEALSLVEQTTREPETRELPPGPTEGWNELPDVILVSPSVNLINCHIFDSSTNSVVLEGIETIRKQNVDLEDQDCELSPSHLRDGMTTAEVAFSSRSSLLGLSDRASGHSTITGLMAAAEVVQHLSRHGCENLIDHLDFNSFSQYPLSSGGFGDVYRGAFCSGVKVAIKAVRDHVPSGEDSKKSLKRAARELYIWSKCEHPNILPLLGLVVFRNQLGMVSRWMENGNLLTYIKKNPSSNRYDMSAQICDGLAYLHRDEVGIIHGDLKGANIVVSPDGAPMLTDFGNSVLQNYTLHFTQTTHKNGLSVRWTAPELIDEGDIMHSIAADVYALGMTILETFTGRVPFYGKTDRAVYAAVMKHKTPDRPGEMSTDSHQMDRLWSLLNTCWNSEPAKRPSAYVVAQSMRSMGNTTPELIRRSSVQTKETGEHDIS